MHRSFGAFHRHVIAGFHTRCFHCRHRSISLSLSILGLLLFIEYSVTRSWFAPLPLYIAGSIGGVSFCFRSQSCLLSFSVWCVVSIAFSLRENGPFFLFARMLTVLHQLGFAWMGLPGQDGMGWDGKRWVTTGQFVACFCLVPISLGFEGLLVLGS